MTLRTTESNMPKNYRKMHLAARLQCFISMVVLPVFFDHDIKAKDVTMGIIDKERMVLRYQGDDLGMITLSGYNLTFSR